MPHRALNLKNSLLTVKEAAAFLNVSVPTVKNYIYKGKLVSVKTPGGHHRIRMSDLGALVETGRKQPSDERPLVDIITGLVKIIQQRELFSREHAESVAGLCRAVAEELGFSDEEKENLHLAALLHDIGKVGISDVILNKPAGLTDDEFSRVKKHAQMGESIVKSMGRFERICSIIRHHHERFDGKGYPDGLCGQDIDIEARIIAIAEAFDSMTTKKPYKEAMSVEKALKKIEQAADSQFDPEIVTTFLKTQQKIKNS